MAELPAWARQHVVFGEFVAASSVTTDTIVRAALIVPAHEYAAICVALGAISHSTLLSAEATGRDLELVPGSLALYTRDNTTYECIVTDTPLNNLDGLTRIAITGKRSGRGQLPIGSKVVLPIDKYEDVHAILPGGRCLADIHGIEVIACVFGQAKAARFVSGAHLEVVICGHKGRLKTEAAEFEIELDSTKACRASDILRPRCNDCVAYRSDIVTERTPQESETEQSSPKFVVFDGARAFLNNRMRWPKSSWIAVIDRTESCEVNSQAVSILQNVFGQAKNLTFPAVSCASEYRACALEGEFSW